MSLHLDHVNLVCRDLGAQTAFYREVLGAQVILDRELSGDWVDQLLGQPGATMDCVILELPGGGPRVELLAYRHPAPVEVPHHDAPAGYGLRHVAFQVEALEPVLDRLRAAGGTLLGEPVTVPFPVGGRRKRLVYCHDPEGVLLELAEYTAWPG